MQASLPSFSSSSEEWKSLHPRIMEFQRENALSDMLFCRALNMSYIFSDYFSPIGIDLTPDIKIIETVRNYFENFNEESLSLVPRSIEDAFDLVLIEHLQELKIVRIVSSKIDSGRKEIVISLGQGFTVDGAKNSVALQTIVKKMKAATGYDVVYHEIENF